MLTRDGERIVQHGLAQAYRNDLGTWGAWPCVVTFHKGRMRSYFL